MLDSTRDFFDTLAKVLLRCWIFGFVLLFLWFGGMLSGAIHKIHGPMMGLSDHELNVITYCGMAFLKLLVLVFFFIPWLAIKLAVKKGVVQMKTTIAFILIGLATAIAQADAAEPTTDVQVLFIGNSFTFFHEMPKMVADLAKAGKQPPLRFVQITPGGYTLERHWKDGKALAAIQSRKWDFVVLQEQSLGPIVNKESMFEYAKKLDAEIRKQGAKTLLYMTWAYQNKPSDQKALSEAYLDLSKEINAEVVPVGLAWEQAIQADENRTLHENDKRHPNATGSYLAACVFYATIYDKSPEGLPGKIGKMTNEKALPLQAIAWKFITDAEKESLRQEVEE